MLENNERINFTDLFEPPERFELEHVWGTSYSISLEAYLMVLLAMENRGRVPEISQGEKISNAQLLAIIERNQKKITLLAQQGLVYFDRNFPPLLQALLWKSIRPQQPEKGSFHPKVWLAAFRNQEGTEPEYYFRLLVTSRNLTQDTDFDAAVVFESEKAGNEGAASNTGTIIELFKDELSEWKDRLRQVVFKKGYFDHADELPDEVHTVISPFLDDKIVGELMKKGLKNLFSTRKAIVGIKNFKTLPVKFFELRPMGISETADADQEEDTAGEPAEKEANRHYGLHAKLYFSTENKKNFLYLGSRNCTWRGWNSNVEFMVKLRLPGHFNEETLLNALVYDPNGTDPQKSGKNRKNALFQPCDVNNLTPETESDEDRDKTTLIEFLRTVKAYASFENGDFKLTLPDDPPLLNGKLKIRPLLLDENKEWNKEIVWRSVDKQDLSPYFVISYFPKSDSASPASEMGLFAEISWSENKENNYAQQLLNKMSDEEFLEYHCASNEVPLNKYHFVNARDDPDGINDSRKKFNASRRYLERMVRNIVADKTRAEKYAESFDRRIKSIELSDGQGKDRLSELKELKNFLDQIVQVEKEQRHE